MSLIWYSGWLDVRQTINPVQLRGYDAAGNLLHSVRLHDLSPHAYATYAEKQTLLYGGADDLRFVEGYDELGNARTIARKDESPLTGHTAGSVVTFAADRRGRLYCALGPAAPACGRLKPAATRAQVLAREAGLNYQSGSWKTADFSDLFESDYYKPYVDFFRVYGQDGERVPFPRLHNKPVRAVAVDAAGDIYTASEPEGAGETFLRKFDLYGNLIWSTGLDRWWPIPQYFIPAQFGAADIYQILRHECNSLIAPDGSIYMTGYAVGAMYSTASSLNLSAGFLRKYSGAGALQWERRLQGISPAITGMLIEMWQPALMIDISTDARSFRVMPISNPVLLDGKIYTGLRHTNAYKIGDAVAFFTPGNSPVSLAVWDGDGNLVATHATPYTAPTTTVTLYGPPQVTLTDIPNVAAAHNPIRELHADDGKLYVTLDAGFYDETNAPIEWIFDPAFNPLALVPSYRDYYIPRGRDLYFWPRFAFDAAHNQYFASTEPTAPAGYPAHFWTFNAAGTRIWVGQSALGDGSSAPAGWGALQVFVVADPEIPPFGFGVRLARLVGIGDRYTALPGFGFGVQLAAPTSIRDYVGPRLPVIYRLYLAGSPPLFLPLASFTVRRSLSGRALSAVIAPPSLATVQAIAARAGNDLVLLRGVRFRDGSEQLDELLRCALVTPRTDRGARQFSISLEGRADEAESGTRIRALKGVSYRAYSAGLRRVRCEVDVWLRPGDTALLGGGETMTVGDITITADRDSGVMELAELA
ncbi:MAG: hypothetical protein IPN66_06390 [Candidatus Competibacteraceae bacterium]|nr:hypothetical protein [Candidatus Competibacteraceae bacterium]